MQPGDCLRMNSRIQDGGLTKATEDLRTDSIHQIRLN